ncbi:hypothetical protein KEF85_07840 [Methylomonas paludis]|uniref:Beta-lactamase-inhibitor-like PepSY-like domain-containing protein n=1 Tax=Methylomonas paludis TaxID=1173101 RepID=A0A975MQX1_9GAMM|nr:hypothetical protein [Methylomonas paludis]QWF72346.1 hypothetical protein KEF85_07840 [Methylomonas paludis]
MPRLIIITLATFWLAGLAQADAVSIPDKVKANILKRHPKAQDFQASHENHFNQRLLEVTYKEEGSEEPILELFRADGHLFTNEVPLVGIGEAPPEVKQALETNFPGYVLKKVEMAGNPNGIGEEYEINLQVGGSNWKVSINDKGEILGKDKVE